MADRYAVPFTGIAFVIAGIAWFVSKDPVRFAEVLVVASPCPLILAAPVALVSGMSRSSRNGIVVKTGSVLEKMATAKTAAFDKTGTITSGRLFVDQIKPVAGDQALILTIFSEFINCHCYRRITIDRTRIDSITNIFGDRSRFTSQARFIKHTTAFDDMPIDRDSLTDCDRIILSDPRIWLWACLGRSDHYYGNWDFDRLIYVKRNDQNLNVQVKKDVIEKDYQLERAMYKKA